MNLRNLARKEGLAPTNLYIDTPSLITVVRVNTRQRMHMDTKLEVLLL
jgi:hypothetical protein